MYVPRLRQGFEVPRALITALALLCAVFTAVLVASLSTRSTSNEADFAGHVQYSPRPRAIAYAVSQNNFDLLYVRGLDPDARPRLLTAFPHVYELHVRGTASPTGNDIAVLHFTGGTGTRARLSLVSVQSGEVRTAERGFEYLSRIAWRPDGSTLTLTRRADGVDNSLWQLVEVDAQTLAETPVHTFDQALDVAPIGYAPAGDRLYVVVIDQSGSTLWAYGEGKMTPITTFSPGLTTDWALSPDGSQIAFVERLGVGQRSRAGRILSISSGRVTDTGATGDQTGVVWRPGSPIPDFGGPAGTVSLTGGEAGSYLVPHSWTFDGTHLVASVVVPERDGAPSRQSVEILSRERRIPLANVAGARFLGLVVSGEE